jgi:hypothetical protein
MAASRHLGGIHCTKSGHAPVDGVHSTENRTVINVCFLLTIKIEGVQTESFFDNFLSFSGWCGVPGLERSHPFMKMDREGEQGSIAKRWSRRTRSQVEGRIEFRGVG